MNPTVSFRKLMETPSEANICVKKRMRVGLTKVNDLRQSVLPILGRNLLRSVSWKTLKHFMLHSYTCRPGFDSINLIICLKLRYRMCTSMTRWTDILKMLQNVHSPLSYLVSRQKSISFLRMFQFCLLWEYYT